METIGIIMAKKASFFLILKLLVKQIRYFYIY